MDKIWLHGEVSVRKTTGEIPKGSKKIGAVHGSYKIADSETTGNHHLLEDIEGLCLYEKDGKFYARPKVATTIRCVDEKRHDSITLEPCGPNEIFIFDKQQEVDHLTDEVTNVRD